MRTGVNTLREGGRAGGPLSRGLSNKISAAKKSAGQGLGPGQGTGPGHAQGPGPGPKRRKSLLRVDLDDFLFDDDGCYQFVPAGER